MSTSKMKFKTELSQLMDIIIHSLYSHREIFLRELISNASDAIDKLRFDALTDKSLLGEGDASWEVTVRIDKDASTLTVSDNGVGMDRDAIVGDLGTIARSGTKAFMEQLKAGAKAGPELIGQFGVGFYSAFMVADTVTVTSRRADSEMGVEWSSDGKGTFSVKDVEKAGRGTDVVLHMKEDAAEYLDPWRVKDLVRRFSNYVEHPIVVVHMAEEKGEDEDAEPTMVEKREVANSQKAIWLRDKKEVEEEEYNEFYKHVSHDFADPLKTIHYNAEGGLEFKSLLFIPSKRPYDYFMSEPKPRLHLYVKRVFITDACEHLLPQYMRFVKGVVDSSDLPLNVSREMLQDNPLLAKIQKNLVKRVITSLATMLEKDRENYENFFKEFGSTLKEGVANDYANREKLADLLLFESTRTEPGKYLTLADYVEQMSEGQEEVYYLCGDSADALRQSPYLERFKDLGQDVLLLADPVDPFFIDHLGEYKEKKLKAVDRAKLDDTEASKEDQKAFKKLLTHLGEALTVVKEVRLSTRLKDSAACLVADENAMSAQMERMMRQMGGGAMPPSPRILELNPGHAAVKTMLALYDADKTDSRVDDLAHIFYDQARLAEGSELEDPAAFARRVNELIPLLGVSA